MSRFINKFILGAALALGLIFTLTYPSEPTPIDKTKAPELNNQKKWRIGYIESESFVNYGSHLYHLLRGLEELGWLSSLEALPYQPGQQDTHMMWQWLAANGVSPYLEFVSDAHYTLSTDPQLANQVIQRLTEKKDLDLVFVMGTYAGTVVATDQHRIPTMVMSASNAVDSNIVKDEATSGIPHVWAHMDSTRFYRQLQVFHDQFNFKKLGMVYENSAAARSYSAVNDAMALGKERGFEVVSYHVAEPTMDGNTERYYRQLAEAYRKLAGEVDAMYITMAAIDSQKLPQLLKPFHDKKIPTLSQLGGSEVKYGVLMSITIDDNTNIGRFEAATLTKILRGTPPGQLPQIFRSTPHILLNLATAERIGYQAPFEILLVADELYPNIAE